MHNGLHVFVFCCSEYKHLADACVKSIRKNIVDDILSINIVSNRTINLDGCGLILDHEFWQKIDPDLVYPKLYSTNWIKQQILKLCVDRYVTGNALIVDAEVLFLKPTKWLYDDKVKIYSSFSNNYKPYFNLNAALLDLQKNYEHSFITDTQVFLTDVLQSLKEDIESKHQRPWLSVLNSLLFESEDNWLSEFELYGNYLMSTDKVYHIEEPMNHIIFDNNRTSQSFDELLINIKKKVDSDFVSVNIDEHSYYGTETRWLTFYYQVKGPDWPTCDNEEDFINLPEHVKNECIDVFGYTPNRVKV